MSSKKNVGIMVVGQFIDPEIIHRFKKCIDLSRPKVTYDVHILSTNDKGQKPNRFNKSKILNKGIKKLCNGDYEVVIQTDIDLVVPPGLVDESYRMAMEGKVCYHNNHRRITASKILNFPPLPNGYKDMDWEYMKTFAVEASNGCWNAIQSQMWWETGGFNEDCVNYAREDDDWARRSKIYGKILFIVTKEFPLMHINHPQRNTNNRRHNAMVIKRALDAGKINWLT